MLLPPPPPSQVKDYDKKRQKAEAAAASRDWRAAQDAFIAALNVDPNHRTGNVGLWLGLCNSRYNLRDYDTAVQDCSNVLILDPNHVQAKALRIRVRCEGCGADGARGNSPRQQGPLLSAFDIYSAC